MALDKTRLRNDVTARLAVLFADPSTPPSAEDVWIEIAEAIITEVVDNLEINGVTTDIGTSLAGVFGGGVPVANDGGAALQTAWTSASSGKQGTQDNGGTGLVS